MLPLDGVGRDEAMALASRPGPAMVQRDDSKHPIVPHQDHGVQLIRRWRRSSRLGADPVGESSRIVEAIVSPAQLLETRERLEEIQQGASEILNGFARRCESTDHVAVLTDDRGVIAHVAGGGAFAREASQRRLIEGAIWSEDLRGTNAIGTALAEGRPVLVDGEAHFARSNGALACIAAPIRDPSGRMLGVLDATAPAARLGALESSLIMDVVRAIEELIRIRAYGPGLGRGRGLQLVERLMERAAGPAFLVERPDRVVRRNHLARELERRMDEPTALPGFEELLRLAEDRGSATWTPRSSGAEVAPWRIEVEPVCGVHGETAGIVVFLVREGRADGVPSAQPHSTSALDKTALPSSTKLESPDRHSAPDADAFAELLGEDRAFRQAIDTARRLAESQLPVLLVAETGTGKELFARGIHGASRRGSGPLVALNCGSLHRDLLLAELFGHARGAYTGATASGRAGALAAAHGGTLFLDEVADLSPEGQTALLRVLETGRYRRMGETLERFVDLRVIAATSRDLSEWTESGRFRSDLFYRLGGAPISIPPLRERTDTKLLAQCLWRSIRAKSAFHSANGCAPPDELSPAAVRALLAHDWPGNVRELRSALEYAAALAPADARAVEPEHLPASIPRIRSAGERASADVHNSEAQATHRVAPMERARHAAFMDALQAAEGNISAAARQLGVARSTVYRLAKRWGVEL
ncbi:MAG: sigma 54-interacting transcriptional regulator [Planctomycetota bacterium]